MTPHPEDDEQERRHHGLSEGQNAELDAWLRRLGQTPQIRAAFWEPLIWAVLNDDPLVASAGMLVAVVERAFMASRADSS